MLIEFSVGNYRSFDALMTLSLEATKLRSGANGLDESNVFSANRLNLLRSAAIYGANASGKSNLVRALNFMRNFVLQSAKESQAGESTKVERFRLNTTTQGQPTHFQIIFGLGDRFYRYGFEVDDHCIHAEWLYYTVKRETRLFMREGDRYEIASSFKEGRGLEMRTRSNALFLSVVAQFNGQLATDLVAWFNNLKVIGPGLDEDYANAYTADFCQKDAVFRQRVVDLIRVADLGIAQLDIGQQSLQDMASDTGMPQPLQDVLVQFVKQSAITMGRLSGEEMPAELILPRTQTFHDVFDGEHHLVGQEVFILEQQESRGTNKIFRLAGFILKALDQGTVLAIDEMEASLHPLLTHTLIQLFNSPQTNPHNAQLIFTTHDTGLLNNAFFRRDQIWFTEKNKYGATDLYSLAELQERNDASFDKNYIAGRYGAIPFIGGLRALFETPSHG